MEYKRMLKRNYFDGDYSVVPEELAKEMIAWREQHATEITAPPVWYFFGERLCQVEDRIEQGTLVDIKTVAKFVSRLLMEESPCPCDLALLGEAVDEYMLDQCEDWCWCEKNCDTRFKENDYMPCWEKYLTAKLKELQGDRE